MYVSSENVNQISDFSSLSNNKLESLIIEDDTKTKMETIKPTFISMDNEQTEGGNEIWQVIILKFEAIRLSFSYE